MDISIIELAEMASKIASVQIDPIEATGKEVPAPDADVDLIDALEEYKRDAVRAAELLEGKPAIEQVLRIHQNHLDWFRFWATRHPSPELREKFRERLAEREAAVARLSERAHAQLARR